MTHYEGKSHHFQEDVTEFIHTINKGKNTFRMIVIKKKITPILPTREETLSEAEKLQHARYCSLQRDGTQRIQIYSAQSWK